MKNIILLSFLSFLIFYKVNAQADFIEPMSKDLFLSDNNREELFYEQESNPKHLEVKPIKMNDLWSFQDNGSFEFSLPDIEAPIYAFAKRPRRYSDRDYIWSGEIYSEEGQLLGDVVFAQEKDKKFGRINIGDRRFMIRVLVQS